VEVRTPQAVPSSIVPCIRRCRYTLVLMCNHPSCEEHNSRGRTHCNACILCSYLDLEKLSDYSLYAIDTYKCCKWVHDNTACKADGCNTFPYIRLYTGKWVPMCNRLGCAKHNGHDRQQSNDYNQCNCRYLKKKPLNTVCLKFLTSFLNFI
jgi:hypothetical protein